MGQARGLKRLFTVGNMVFWMLLFCACGQETGGTKPEEQSGVWNQITGSFRKEKKEQPSDTPWNHGYFSIMETEQGYYANQSSQQFLCFTEKASGMTIPLCNKPECEHKGGDSCEATYRNIRTINSVLYENAIYILGAEKNDAMISLNLYKASLDGSSIDKVGTVIQAENTGDEELTLKQNSIQGGIVTTDFSFIIHKGQAYIPYYLRFGQASKGLKGAGLAKMDLKTGETKEIYGIDRLVDGVPCNLSGIGDYVYFNVFGNNEGSMTKRYHIQENELEEVYASYNEKTYSQYFCLFEEDRIYNLNYHYFGDDTKLCLQPYDAQTGEVFAEESVYLEPDEEAGNGFNQFRNIFFYEDKLMVANDWAAYWFDRQGNRIAKITFPQEQLGVRLSGRGNSDLGIYYHVSNGNLYLLFSDLFNNDYMEFVGENFQIVHRYRVFRCALETIFNGNGEWEEIFSIEGQYKPLAEGDQ